MPPLRSPTCRPRKRKRRPRRRPTRSPSWPWFRLGFSPPIKRGGWVILGTRVASTCAWYVRRQRAGARGERGYSHPFSQTLSTSFLQLRQSEPPHRPPVFLPLNPRLTQSSVILCGLPFPLASNFSSLRPASMFGISSWLIFLSLFEMPHRCSVYRVPRDSRIICSGWPPACWELLGQVPGLVFFLFQCVPYRLLCPSFSAFCFPTFRQCPSTLISLYLQLSLLS